MRRRRITSTWARSATARFLRQGFEAGPVVVLPEIDVPDVHLPEKTAHGVSAVE